VTHVLGGEYEGFHFSGPARTNAATPEQIDQVAALVRRGLARGALGVGLMPFYTPGATEEELKRMFAVAAEVPGAAGYVHLRYVGLGANGQPNANGMRYFTVGTGGSSHHSVGTIDPGSEDPSARLLRGSTHVGPRRSGSAIAATPGSQLGAGDDLTCRRW